MHEPRTRRGLRNLLDKTAGDIGAYIALVVDDPDVKVRRKVFKALILREKDVPAKVIVSVLDTELASESPGRHMSALGLLWFLKTVDVGPYLARCSKYQDDKMRKSLLQTLNARCMEVTAEDTHTILTSQLQSSNAEHRLQAIKTLEKQPYLPLSPYLAMCADDEDPKVRKAVFTILADRSLQLPKADIAFLLTAELTSDAWERRATAIRVLKTLPKFDARALLQLCADDSHPKVREAVQRALRNLR